MQEEGWQINPTCCTGQVILTVLVGFLLVIKSFKKLSCMLKEKKFVRLFPAGTRLTMIVAINNTLKLTDLIYISDDEKMAVKAKLLVIIAVVFK